MAAGGEAPAGAPRESSGSAGAQVGVQRRELALCPPPPLPVTAPLPGSCRCCGEAAPRLAPFLGSLSVPTPPRPAAIPPPPLAAACRPPSTRRGRLVSTPGSAPSPGAPEGPGRARGEAAVPGGLWRGAGSAAAPRKGAEPAGAARPQCRRWCPGVGAAAARGVPPVELRPWGSARGIPPVSCASSLRFLPIPSSVALEGLSAFSKKDAP